MCPWREGRKEGKKEGRRKERTKHGCNVASSIACFIKPASRGTPWPGERSSRKVRPHPSPPQPNTVQTKQFCFYLFYLFINENEGHILTLGRLDEKPGISRQAGSQGVVPPEKDTLQTLKGCLPRQSTAWRWGGQEEARWWPCLASPPLSGESQSWPKPACSTQPPSSGRRCIC